MHGKPDEILGMLSSMQKGRWENDDMREAFGRKKATGEAATSDQRQAKNLQPYCNTTGGKYQWKSL